MKKQAIIYMCFVLMQVYQCIGSTPTENLKTSGLKTSFYVFRNTAITTGKNMYACNSARLNLLQKKQEQNLIAKVLNWDCKLKVRLNRNFNFIVSYN